MRRSLSELLTFHVGDDVRVTQPGAPNEWKVGQVTEITDTGAVIVTFKHHDIDGVFSYDRRALFPFATQPRDFDE